MIRDAVVVCYRVGSLYVTGYYHWLLQGSIAVCYRELSLYVTGYHHCMLQGSVAVCYRIPTWPGIDKSAEWSTIPTCPSLVGFFFFLNRGNTEGTNSSKMLCLIFLYVCFVWCKFASGLILQILKTLWFGDFCVCRISRRQIEVCFSPDVILCGWLGSKYHRTCPCMLQDVIIMCYRVVSQYVIRYRHCVLRVLSLCVTGYSHCMLQSTVTACYEVPLL